MAKLSATGGKTGGFAVEGTVARLYRHVPREVIADARAGEPVAFFDREATGSIPQRRFSEADVFEMGLRAILWTAVRVFSPRMWSRVAGATSRLRRFRHVRRKMPPVVKAAMAAGLAASPEEGARLYDDYRRRLHERRLMFLREGVRPGPVRFDIQGLDALERVLAEGRGAILWTSPFAFQTLAGKRGLHEAGQEIVQVSARSHGFSDSVFGVRFLNRPLVAAENHYLAGRLVLEPETTAATLRQAVRILKSGRPVWFTNNTYAGRSFLQVPFGPAAWFLMPQTPLLLARRNGVALFTVETIETESFAAYAIQLTECPVPGGDDFTDQEAVARGALAVRDAMLAAARRAPDQFMGLPSICATPAIRLNPANCAAGSSTD